MMSEGRKNVNDEIPLVQKNTNKESGSGPLVIYTDARLGLHVCQKLSEKFRPKPKPKK